MTLSVIVTSYDSPALLDRCLAALTQQPAIGEIVVADCSPVDPSGAIRGTFPSVTVLHSPQRRTVPQLRWGAIAHTRGDVIAAIEARCVPSGDWAAELMRAHERHLEAVAIGGPVAPDPRASWLDWGLYFAEYGAFIPPVRDGEVRQLSGANLSYKRDALVASQDLLDQGVWEAALHERWLQQGRPLRLCPATITFQNGMRPLAALRMRWHYGRSYAAGRFTSASLRRRVVYGVGTVLLPLLMIWRVGQVARAKGYAAPFWRALPWTLALDTAWSAGEAVGYLVGASRHPHIY